MIRNLARDEQVFTSNVFLVPGERTALVDVGNEFDVVGAVREAGSQNGTSDESSDATVDVDLVVLTHTHYDHVANLDAVRDAFDATVVAYDETFPGVDEPLADGETVTLGDDEYRALHTPGHKDDHLCLYADAAGVLFAGDLVFANGGFGRTDLDEGDRETLVESIRYVLDVVDEDLREMHAGHGPSVETDPYRDLELALSAARL